MNYSKQKKDYLRRLSFILLLFLTISTVQAQNIVRYGGGGTGGDGIDALLTGFNDPEGLVVDDLGNLYIVDQFHHRVRMIDILTRQITNYAGTGVAGFADGPRLTVAQFTAPNSQATDAAGNIFICDYSNQRLRRIDRVTNNVTTIAGSGVYGYDLDGTPAIGCRLSTPLGIAVDPAGNVYFSEAGTHLVRMVDPGGILHTIAGTPGVAGYAGDGGPALGARLNTPRSLLWHAGMLYVVDAMNQRIRVINITTGTINLVAGNGVAAFAGDGGDPRFASLNLPSDLAFDVNGRLFIADELNNRIRVVNFALNTIQTFAGNGVNGNAGDGGAALAASIGEPDFITFDCGGNLVIAQENGDVVRKVIIDNPPVFVAGTITNFDICQNAPAFNISALLGITDIDPGQIEAWTIHIAPSHGTLGGFIERLPSGPGTITPIGLTYTPTAGYVGPDGFDIRIVDCGGLEDIIHVDVNVRPQPAAFAVTVTGGGHYCAGGSGVTVGLAGSTPGVNYQLFRGATLVGGPMAGTGAALNFGLQLIAGIYTVVATNATTGCTATMTGSATVVIDPIPALFSITGGGSYCAGGTGVNISLSGSQPGVSYQLKRGALNVGAPLTGSGGILSFGLHTIAGTYTVIANPLSACPATMTGSAIISIDPIPLPLTPSSTGPIISCSSSTVISVSGGSGGSIYFQGTTAGGTSTTILSSSETITSSGTYYFREQSSAGCWGADCSFSVTFTAGPTANAGPPQSVCAGGTITLAGSIGGGASSSTWSCPTGTGSFFDVTSLTSTFTPSITSGTVTLTLTTNDPDGAGPCTAATSTVVITVDPAPAALTPAGAGSFCGTSTTISAGPAVSGVTIYFQGTTSGGTSTATPSSSEVVTASGTYYFRPQSSAGCWGPQCAINVVLYSGFTANAGLPQSVCAGGTITLAGSIGGGATTSTWSAPSGTFSAPGSLTSTYTPSITSGTVILTLTTDDPPGPCPPAVSTVVITVNPLPTAFVVVGGGSYCAGGTGVPVGLSGSTIGVSYQLLLAGTPVGSPMAGTGSGLTFGMQTAAGVYTVVATNTTTFCTRNMASSVTIAVNPMPGTIVGPTSVCENNTTVTYTNTVPGGTWSSSVTTVANIHNITGVLYPHVAGTTTITYTNSCGSVSFLLTILAAPTPISFTPTHVCEAATATLTDATPGGNWISANPTIATVDFWSGVVTGVMAGVATIDYILPTGCFVSRTITVDHIEPITGIPDHPCAWGSTFMVHDVTPGGLFTSSSVTVLNLGFGDGLATTSGPGPATITYTAGVCATTVHFIVDPLPLGFTFIGAGTGCYGTAYPVKLASSQVGASYQLFRSGTPVGAPLLGTGGLLDFGPQTAVGVYTIVSTIIATGCSVNMYGTLTINPLPEPITGYTAPICPGATVLLSTTSTGGTWSSSNTSIATVGVSGLVTGVSGGLATISYTLPTGCYVTQLVNVLPPGTLSGPSTVCTGTTITLTDAFPGGTWSSSTTDATVIAGTSPGTGDVTGVSMGSTIITYAIGGCYVTKAISVLPSPTPIMGAPVSICAGDVVIIYDLTWSGTWSSSNTAILDIVSTYTGSAEYCKIKGISAGTATMTYTSGGCYVTVDIIVNPLPGPFPPVSVYPGCTVSVPDPGTGTWSSFDPTIATATGMTGHCVIYGATLAGGTTTVTYTSSITGCSNSFVVTVIYSGGYYACKPGRTDDPTSITETSTLKDVKIYPNPATTTLHVEAPVKVFVSISGVDGRMLMDHLEAVSINIGELANGMYMIKVYDENNVLLKTDKFVKVQQ